MKLASASIDPLGIQRLRCFDHAAGRRVRCQYFRLDDVAESWGKSGFQLRPQQSGSMVVRWTSAAIIEAEKKFRRVQGWRDIETLITALSEFENNEEAEAEFVA